MAEKAISVQMLATAAGPAGQFMAGKYYLLPESQARAFIAAGAAREAQPPQPVERAIARRIVERTTGRGQE